MHTPFFLCSFIFPPPPLPDSSCTCSDTQSCWQRAQSNKSKVLCSLGHTYVQEIRLQQVHACVWETERSTSRHHRGASARRAAQTLGRSQSQTLMLFSLREKKGKINNPIKSEEEDSEPVTALDLEKPGAFRAAYLGRSFLLFRISLLQFAGISTVSLKGQFSLIILLVESVTQTKS